VNRQGLLMVTKGRIFAGDGQHTHDPAGIGPQEIGLQGQSIAVAHADLHHGFHAARLQQHGAGQSAHVHHGIAHIGNHERVELVPHRLDIGQHAGDVRSFGGLQFGQKRKFTVIEFAFQMHCASSLRLTAPILRSPYTLNTKPPNLTPCDPAKSLMAMLSKSQARAPSFANR